jgi:hypothetical protein
MTLHAIVCIVLAAFIVARVAHAMIVVALRERRDRLRIGRRRVW